MSGMTFRVWELQSRSKGELSHGQLRGARLGPKTDGSLRKGPNCPLPAPRRCPPLGGFGLARSSPSNWASGYHLYRCLSWLPGKRLSVQRDRLGQREGRKICPIIAGQQYLETTPRPRIIAPCPTPPNLSPKDVARLAKWRLTSLRRWFSTGMGILRGDGNGNGPLTAPWTLGSAQLRGRH